MKGKTCTKTESFYNSHQFSNFVAFVSAPLSPSSSFFLLLSQTQFWSYPGDQLPLQSKKDPKLHFASHAGCLSHLWACHIWKEILWRGTNRREEPQPQEEDKCRLDHRSRCTLSPWLNCSRILVPRLNCSGTRVNSPVPRWSIGPEKVWKLLKKYEDLCLKSKIKLTLSWAVGFFWRWSKWFSPICAVTAPNKRLRKVFTVNIVPLLMNTILGWWYLMEIVPSIKPHAGINLIKSSFAAVAWYQRDIELVWSRVECSLGGIPLAHWQSERGPVPVVGFCSKESFRIHGYDSDLEVFSSQIADRIIASLRIVRTMVRRIMFLESHSTRKKLHHVKN